MSCAAHPRDPRRRRLLLGSAATGVLLAGAGTAWLRPPRHDGTLFSAFEDARGEQYIGGLSLHDGVVFGARVPMRAHGCALDPDGSRAVFFARRPGTQAFELTRSTHQARTLFETPPGRHLAGHGVFSPDGRWLYTPEHDYENARGVLAVRDVRTWRIVEEIDTRGIDPHEVRWWQPGRTLLVANGGILTHPRSFRRKLNIPTMDPSLCLIDAASGECLEQWRFYDHLLSIRHLAVARGSAAVGLQYEGEPQQAPGVVALYRPGAGLELLQAPAAERARFRGYVASVAVSEALDLVAAACPYGQGIACWALSDARYLGFIRLDAVYGLSSLADGVIVASQRDGTAVALESRRRSHFLDVHGPFPLRWDDHWVAA